MKKASQNLQHRLWRKQQLFDLDFNNFQLTDHSFPKHFHDHYVIEWVQKGFDQFYCNGKNFTALEGDIVLINPGEVHTGSTLKNNSLKYFSICPDQNALKKIAGSAGCEITDTFFFAKTIISDPSLTQKFKSFFVALSTNATDLQQQELLTAAIHGLFQTSTPSRSTPVAIKKDARISLLCEYIRSHWQDNISLNEMAEFVNMNHFHLIRVFKKATGLSPYEYLLILRTEAAKQFLRKGYKVQDAALEAGFYDSSHLYRSLQKFTGISPKSLTSSKGQYHTILTA